MRMAIVALLTGALMSAVSTPCAAQGCEETPLTNAKASLYDPAAPLEHASCVPVGPGPHLFIDDFYVAAAEGVTREVQPPVRDGSLPNPIVTGKGDGCFQPYMTILRDEGTDRFRLWYGRHTEDSNASRSLVGYLESPDGIHWERPARTLEMPGPIQFGVSVVDRGPAYAGPARRYAFGWYMDGGLKMALSPDGLTWSFLSPDPVIRHNHDITSIFFDPIRDRYIATVSVYRPGWWKDNRRVTMHAYSRDLATWTPPRYVVLPDPVRDDGETQFYAMDGYLVRGDLIIGMVKVLRDDLKADDPPDPPDAYGVGYTTLAWSRDGEAWVRDTAPFFAPDPGKGAWDHAHAWVDEQVPVGDKVYLYYGGYARGHKVNRFEERQIGLVTITRDRYVARRAQAERGILRTPPLRLDGGGMTLNVDSRGGSVRARCLDAGGAPIPGFGFEDCAAISTDSIDAPLAWKHPLTELRGKDFALEFELARASLYGFAVTP